MKANTDNAQIFVDFVENKIFQADELLQIMSTSIRENRHSNFGPVTEDLERVLLVLNGENPHRAACSVTNATLGCQAVASTFENSLGHSLRWAVSDFGFFNSSIGPFQNHLPISCQADGMISIQQLRKLPLDSYDAVLATNIFGLREDFSDLFEFCRVNNKILLIDNAAGFSALAPFHAEADNDDKLLWAEVVSFHHTKPWGMGEGGAVFLPKELDSTFRAAINFGIGDGRQLHDVSLCTNAKMSEVAAAQILSRVRAHKTWIPAYRDQAERLLELGKVAGLLPLIKHLPARAVPGQIPFLCDHPIPLDKLENPFFKILKYYRPSPHSSDNARFIYERVLNIPCHPEMARLDDDVIVKVLRTITQKL